MIWNGSKTNCLEPERGCVSDFTITSRSKAQISGLCCSVVTPCECLRKSIIPLAFSRPRALAQKPDGPQLPRLLCACRERPNSRRSTNYFDEIASSHCLAGGSGVHQQCLITPGICDRRNGGWTSFCAATILTTECPLWVKIRHRKGSAECPLHPRKRTLVERVGMSALCQ